MAKLIPLYAVIPADCVARDSSYTAMLSLIANFQKTVLFYDVPTEFPLLLSQQSHPALWHAWIAASISFHSPTGSSDYWKHKELQHHTNAVARLRKDIAANPQSQSQWRRAVVLMLYIYEVSPKCDPVCCG